MDKTKDSPAGEAGLRGSFKPMAIQGQRILVGGDVITALDRGSVATIQGLQVALQQYEPGQRAGGGFCTIGPRRQPERRIQESKARGD